MIPMENTIGIGPWSLSVGPLAIVVLAGIVALVIYYARKNDD